MALFTSVSGSILKAQAQAIVNPINSLGLTGSGVARQIAVWFPENQNALKRRGKPVCLPLHTTWWHEMARPSATGVQWIANLAVRQTPWDKPTLGDVAASLRALAAECRRRPSLRTIALPQLAPDSDGVRWIDIKPLASEAFRDLPNLRVLLYDHPDRSSAWDLSRRDTPVIVREDGYPEMPPLQPLGR